MHGLTCVGAVPSLVKAYFTLMVKERFLINANIYFALGHNKEFYLYIEATVSSLAITFLTLIFDVYFDLRF